MQMFFVLAMIELFIETDTPDYCERSYAIH